MAPTYDPPLRLRPPTLAVWRGPGQLQVGIADSGLLLEQVPPQIADMVGLLNQPRTKAELINLVPGLTHEWADWVCAHLISAGVLVTADPPNHPRVWVVGEGLLARTLISMLKQVQIEAFSGQLEDALNAQTTQLAVVADRRAEPDRTLTDRLTLEGISHLVIRIKPATAAVGPLVIPGVTCCLRCEDLARRDLDQGWPMLLAQLSAMAPAPDRGLLDWACATAVAQIRAWSGGHEPDTLGRCLELRLNDFRLRSRSWPVQPACGCTPVPQRSASLSA